MNTIYTQIREKTVVWKQLPVYMILAGVAICVAAVGDLLARKVVTEEVRLIWTGLAVFGSGIALDLALGQRFTVDWLKEATAVRRDLGRFLLVSVELGLLTFVIHEYQIGNLAFYEGIAILTFLGFLIHNSLPLSYRLPFFLILSLLV